MVPPFDPDPAVERWGTNNVMFARYGGDFTQWTRWFDLHRTPHIQTRRPQAYDWYTQQSGAKPIYQWERNPEIPGSRAYPREAVQAYFKGERDFWGSLSWMLALAIYEGFTAIDLFWFPLNHDRADAGGEIQIPVGQYTHQVPSTRYWIGQARGRGIDVTIHGDSALTPNHPLYGYETT